MIWSADFIVLKSCSTIITVLPISLKDSSVFKRRLLSLGCKPIEGSSRTYNTPVNCEPTCEARRILCASPPERVRDALSNDNYPNPTLIRNESLFSVSFKIPFAISRSFFVIDNPLKKASVS